MAKKCYNTKTEPVVARFCDNPSCKTFEHPGCMIPSRGDMNKELWQTPWFCTEHMPSRASPGKASPSKAASGGVSTTKKSKKSLAALQSAIDIAATEDLSATIRVLGDNLIEFGEQALVAKKRAESDFEVTKTQLSDKDDEIQRLKEQLASAKPIEEESEEDKAKQILDDLFDKLQTAWIERDVKSVQDMTKKIRSHLRSWTWAWTQEIEDGNEVWNAELKKAEKRLNEAAK